MRTFGGKLMKPTRLFGFAIASALIMTASPLYTAGAADYPPSIETLEVGKPLAEKVTPKVAGTTAVVPVATSEDIPVVIGEPVTAAKANLANKTLTNASVESSPVKLTSSLTMGGIGADEKAPLASISSGKKSEVQIPIDVPTRVSVSGLKASAKGTASFVDATGKSVSLGRITVSKSGKVTIPALTFAKANVSYTIKLVINGKTTTFTIRSTN